MARPIIILSKVIGTVALGCLTGTIAATSYISIGSLANITTTAENVDNIKARFLKLAKPLSLTAALSLATAYIFASPSGRHPYLIYAILTIPIVRGLLKFRGLPLLRTLSAEQRKLTLEATSQDQSVEPTTPSPESPLEEERSTLDNSVYRDISRSDFESEEEILVSSNNRASIIVDPPARSFGPINPSRLHVSTVEQLASLGYIAGAITGLGFLISTVGIYGDLS